MEELCEIKCIEQLLFLEFESDDVFDDDANWLIGACAMLEILSDKTLVASSG
jgi:hypothetical protein